MYATGLHVLIYRTSVEMLSGMTEDAVELTKINYYILWYNLIIRYNCGILVK